MLTQIPLESGDVISFGPNAANTVLLFDVKRVIRQSRGEMSEHTTVRLERRDLENLVTALRAELQTGPLPEISNVERP